MAGIAAALARHASLPINICMDMFRKFACVVDGTGCGVRNTQGQSSLSRPDFAGASSQFSFRHYCASVSHGLLLVLGSCRASQAPRWPPSLVDDLLQLFLRQHAQMFTYSEKMRAIEELQGKRDSTAGSGRETPDDLLHFLTICKKSCSPSSL